MVNHIRKQKVPDGYQMVSFDVTRFLPTHHQMILSNSFYDEFILIKKLTPEKKNVLKKEMKELLHLCTKNVNLIFNGEIYIQIDGVVMGSPLDPAVVNIFMAEHEKILIPKLVKE